MEMKSARLPNLAASLAFSESLTHFLHRGLASRHSQSPKKRRRPHSAHDVHRLLSLSLVYTLTTGSTVPSPPSSASSTRFVHAPAARSLRCARVGAVPTSDIATRCGPEGGQHEGGRAGWFPAGSITRVNSRIARDRGGGRFGTGSGDASRAKRVARVADHAPPRGGGAVRRRVRVVESNARVNASSDRSSDKTKAVSERWKLQEQRQKSSRVERNFRRSF